MRINPSRIPTTGIGLVLAARHVVAALSILIVTGPAAALDLGVGIQAGGAEIGTSLGVGRNGTSVGISTSLGSGGVNAGASVASA